MERYCVRKYSFPHEEIQPILYKETMSTALIESVPNFSEGRNRESLDAISAALSSVPGAALLHRDSGPDAGRTVYSLAGEVPAVLAALKAGAREAFARIDMRLHEGNHPRLGALDVLPLIPLSGMNMEDCAGLARDLARDIAQELGVPFYLYAQSARNSQRRALSDIRRGGYEGLEAKLADDEWIPDFGPRLFVPSWGASVCGARDFLIAWNINLEGGSLEIAKKIAARLRFSPQGRGDATGGPFPGLKAIGWWMEGYGRAQISCNVYDIHAAPLAQVYLHARKLASEYGCGLGGSELIGLIPLRAMEASGRAFWKAKEKPERGDLIQAAVEGLGLDALGPFRARERILELALQEAGIGVPGCAE